MTKQRKDDLDSSGGLPRDEAVSFINYMSAATAIIMDETGMTKKQAHAALMRKKRPSAVESVVEFLHDNPELWRSKK